MKRERAQPTPTEQPKQTIYRARPKLELGETIKMSKPNLRSVPRDEPTSASDASNSASNGHGGARKGAGRKPKALRYADDLATAEGQIIAALPDVIEGLIRAAKGGDVAAARYLMDRVWGRVAPAAAPVAEDSSIPPDEEEFELIDAEKRAMNDLRRSLI